MTRHHRGPLERWPHHDDPMWTLRHVKSGTLVRLDHPWLEENERVRVTGRMRKGQRRVVIRQGQGGRLALPWETPVVEKVVEEGPVQRKGLR